MGANGTRSHIFFMPLRDKLLHETKCERRNQVWELLRKKKNTLLSSVTAMLDGSNSQQLQAL